MPHVPRDTSIIRRCLGLSLVLVLASCGSGNDEPGGPNVTLTFCADDAPSWLSYRDGQSGWVTLGPSTGTTYEFLLQDDAGAVAYVTASGTGLIVDYGSIAELNTIRCPTGSNDVAGSVADVPVGDRAEVSLGWSHALMPSGPANGFVLHDVADAATQDLIAVRGNDDDEHYLANRLVLRRGAAVPLGGTLPQLDFASAEAVVPDYPTVNIAAPAGLTLSDLASFYIGNQQSTLALLSHDGPLPDAENTFAAIPSNLLGTSDMQYLEAVGHDIAGERTAGVFFRTSQNRQLSFGPALNAPDVTYVGYPDVALVSQAEYGRVVTSWFIRNNAYIVMTVTAAYYGGTPDTWEISVPDLSHLPTYPFIWQTDYGFDWEVSASGGAIPSFDQDISDGAVTRSATRSGRVEQLSSRHRGARLPAWGFPGQTERLDHGRQQP